MTQTKDSEYTLLIAKAASCPKDGETEISVNTLVKSKRSNRHLKHLQCNLHAVKFNYKWHSDCDN